MKADTAYRLMRGEVKHPVGPPQAHSLGDEKVLPVAQQVPAFGSDMFNLGPYENTSTLWPGLLWSRESTTHRLSEPELD